MGAAREGDAATRRSGWWPAFVALLLVVTVAGVWAVQQGGSRPSRGAEVAPGASPSPSIPPIARQQVWTSDTRSSGTYLLNTVTAAPQLPAPATLRYVVKVEDTVSVAPDEAAAEIQRTLDDPRGWAGYGKRNFALVADESKAGVVIYVASPSTTHDLCKAADVGFAWSCSDRTRIVLNADRWRFMTPTYDDLGAYRSYLVNHEMGRVLGQGVATCAKPGAKAPVMMQQGADLGGCLPNAWPRDAD